MGHFAVQLDYDFSACFKNTLIQLTLFGCRTSQTDGMLMLEKIAEYSGLSIDKVKN